MKAIVDGLRHDWRRRADLNSLAIALVLILVAFLFKVNFEQGGKLEDSIDANCTVLSVLLENRADRDATVKLFAPIRRQNPEQFDRLVKRAEKGDRRLLAVAPDLSCEIDARTLRALRR